MYNEHYPYTHCWAYTPPPKQTNPQDPTMNIHVSRQNEGRTQNSEKYLKPPDRLQHYEESYPFDPYTSHTPVAPQMKTSSLEQRPALKQEDRFVKPSRANSHYSRSFQHPERQIAGTKRILNSNLSPQQREKVHREYRLFPKGEESSHRTTRRYFNQRKVCFVKSWYIPRICHEQTSTEPKIFSSSSFFGNLRKAAV